MVNLRVMANALVAMTEKSFGCVGVGMTIEAHFRCDGNPAEY